MRDDLKEHFQSESHDGGHGTEMGWLVSYADMMTLLFGLFVILFTLATDKSKDVGQVMKQVSDQYFGKGGDQPIPSPETHVAASEAQQNEDIKSERAALEAEKKALLEERKTLERHPESSKPVDVTVPLQKQIVSLQSELKEQKSENEQLRSEIEHNKSPTQNYMMVLLTWETEKHDLDLQIATPSQKIFNFKRRKIRGEPGQFQLDSRYGPGIEAWQAENFAVGNYHAKVLLYNQNGNMSKAHGYVTIITNRQTYKSDPIELSVQGQERDVSFSIDADGAVEFGK